MHTCGIQELRWLATPPSIPKWELPGCDLDRLLVLLDTLLPPTFPHFPSTSDPTALACACID